MSSAAAEPSSPPEPQADPHRPARNTGPTLRLLMAGCALVLATGCATLPGAGNSGNAAATDTDPFENFNRKVYAFNDTVDKAVLKPLAQAYQAMVPALVRTGVTNVFGNIGDVWSAANHLLQGKLFPGLDMGMRVLTNTFFGLGGLLDPATEMGLLKRQEDFGQTLGRWGVPSGPYLVLPLLGPSTLRDTAALPVDRQASASNLPPTSSGSFAFTSLELVNLRANLLATTRLLDQVALDEYSFVRGAYLARRQAAVLDGSGAPAAMDTGDPGDSPPAPVKPAPK